MPYTVVSTLTNSVVYKGDDFKKAISIAEAHKASSNIDYEVRQQVTIFSTNFERQNEIIGLNKIGLKTKA